MQTVEPTGEIHPAADFFPMLPEDELQSLANSIRENGLREPIVLDENGTLIDGRNRLAACRIAGVEPSFTSVNSDDSLSLIADNNIERRNLNKGQKVLSRVMFKLYLRDSFERGEKQEIARQFDVKATYVSFAISVSEHDDLVSAVMSGTSSLPEAYEESRRRKEANESREEQARRAERDLTMLRVNAPDLADLVAEERMSLRDAMGAYRERQQEEQEVRTNLTRSFASAVAGLYGSILQDPERVAKWWVPDIIHQRKTPALDAVWTSDGLRDLAQSLEAVADAVERHHDGVLR